MGWNVFVTRRIPQPGIDILLKHCDHVDVNPHDRPMTHDEILKSVKGRDGVICLLTDAIDSAVFQAADKARIFANYAVGYNNIDIQAANRRGILVTNTPGVLTEATADLTWALIFALARRIAESDRFTRNGLFKGWGPMLLLGSEVYGKTLGVVGAGRIGAAVARRASGFNMRVLYADSKKKRDLEDRLDARRAELETLLRESDFVSLHVPLTPETTHLIGKHELEMMKESALLVNTSRGPVVDEQALVDALESGRIAGAGLDVYEEEPRLNPGLIQLDNVILLPHIGSATVEARTQMAVMAAENLLAGLRGDVPPNLVNPEVVGKH